ncbi:TonB-dependent receptor [Stakelama saccharophila]|uniref:TonB-dependent receptor n=1 Tax=Stakelama saccharophila TaxID=3075605 RepID=A0ABZ0B9M7_9SPHN|nr:TonB-dependent receptor [Stakelama sp. W311]WNO53558.1 TonB-dependent receptor [Stakelama sp. W311]
MNNRNIFCCSASALAVMSMAAGAHAQSRAGETPQSNSISRSDDQTVSTLPGQEIVVTGIRESLARAAEIKRDSPQVVDSIVAEDIGKFPDPTTAGALQRVPGVQVAVGANNEITGVRVRGLDDITTTLDGREIFSATGRGFAFQDLPAAALARVDVIKTSTADLIEGGIASTINLQLNKPFNFNKPTIVATARGNYENNADKINPQASLLATDSWETGIGKIGVLVNASYAYFDYDRSITFDGLRRSLDTGPFNVPGAIAPLNFGAVNTYGQYDRPEVNGSIQWQATPELQVYVDGLFTGYESDHQTSFLATPFFVGGTTVSNIVTNPDQCFDTPVAPNGFYPTQDQFDNGQYTTQNLCKLESATFDNVPLNSSTQSFRDRNYNYLGAFGLKYDSDATHIDFDIAYQKSTGRHEAFIVDVGKRITVNLQTDVNGAGVAEQPGNPAGDPEGWAFWHGLAQTFNKSNGDMWQGRFDITRDLDDELGILQKFQFGARFSRRAALFQEAVVNTPAPGGDFATPVAGNAPDGFMVPVPGVPRVNDGADGYGPDPDYLRSDDGRDLIRALYGTQLGNPAYQPEREFDAKEKTYAVYTQLGYAFDIGGPVKADGLIGGRVVNTERSISGAGVVNGVAVPVDANRSDTKWLPNASLRVQFGGGLQARATYSRTMRRPNFGDLNPGLNYVVSTNPNVINSGSAGNPDLRPQVSDSYDATLEYYWNGGFAAVAGFYRTIEDRVVGDPQRETIDGQEYNINRPRNIGSVKLKGVEVSGQTFFNFLPGALSGLGVFGNFTYIDSKIGGDDPLAGYPLLGVSKYNFNSGLLYDHSGISGRLVYTYRSKYAEGNSTGTNTLRPDPVVLSYVRSGGRLDFSVGYDITKAIRVDVGGTNILHNKYKSYYAVPWLPIDYRDDGTTYTVGLRVKI